MPYRLARGFGDTLATAVAAPPAFGLVNSTQKTDVTNSNRRPQFFVGDAWLASITNVASGQPVSVHAIQSGQDLGTSVVGTTSNDMFNLRGSMDPSTVGDWYEVWSVPGGKSAYPSIPDLPAFSQSVRFTVAPQSAASTTGTPATPPPTDKTGAPDTGGKTATPPAPVANWFTESMIGGIPNWGLLAAGAGVLLLFGGKH